MRGLNKEVADYGIKFVMYYRSQSCEDLMYNDSLDWNVFDLVSMASSVSIWSSVLSTEDE